jgi:hypothetical protein
LAAWGEARSGRTPAKQNRCGLIPPARSRTSVPAHGFLDLAVPKTLTDSEPAVERRRITDGARPSKEGPSNLRGSQAPEEAWYTESPVAAGT